MPDTTQHRYRITIDIVATVEALTPHAIAQAVATRSIYDDNRSDPTFTPAALHQAALSAALRAHPAVLDQWLRANILEIVNDSETFQAELAKLLADQPDPWQAIGALIPTLPVEARDYYQRLFTDAPHFTETVLEFYEASHVVIQHAQLDVLDSPPDAAPPTRAADA